MEHERTVLTFSDGPTFELVQTFATGSYSVKVTDQTGISSKAKGIFGVFMEDESYHIVNHNLEDDVGMVVTSKKSVPAVRKGSFQNNIQKIKLLIFIQNFETYQRLSPYFRLLGHFRRRCSRFD